MHSFKQSAILHISIFAFLWHFSAIWSLLHVFVTRHTIPNNSVYVPLKTFFCAPQISKYTFYFWNCTLFHLRAWTCRFFRIRNSNFDCMLFLCLYSWHTCKYLTVTKITHYSTGWLKINTPLENMQYLRNQWSDFKNFWSCFILTLFWIWRYAMYPLHVNYTTTLTCKTITMKITIFTGIFW